MNTESHEEPAMLTLGHARAHLTRIWLLWSACIFTLVIVQSTLHKYGGGTGLADGAVALSAPSDNPTSDTAMKEDRTVDMWKWLLPNIFPTLTMMVSAVAAGAFIQKETIVVRRDFYISAMGLSIFYLATLSGLLICQPIANPTSAAEQLKSLQTSNIATGPVQGLVAAALGVLFSTGHASGKKPTDPDKAAINDDTHSPDPT